MSCWRFLHRQIFQLSYPILLQKHTDEMMQICVQAHILLVLSVVDLLCIVQHGYIGRCFIVLGTNWFAGLPLGTAEIVCSLVSEQEPTGCAAASGQML